MTDALELYNRGLDIACPRSMTKERMGTLHPQVLEMFRDKFNFLVQHDMLTDAILHAEKMVDLFEAFESESSMCKMMFSITVLTLSSGDVVKAEQVYLQQHLNSSTYINSKECKMADDFILAFKNYDLDLLDKALACPDLNYVDREIQKIARRLSFLNSKTAAERSLDKMSKDLNCLALSSGIASSVVADAFDDNGDLVEGVVGTVEYNDIIEDEIDLT